MVADVDLGNPRTDAPVRPASRRRRAGRVGLIAAAGFLGLIILAAAIGPLVIQYDPVATFIEDRLQPPGSRRLDGTLLLLGSDQTGRDLFAQIVHGARVSVLVGVLTVLISGSIGTVLGLVSGYFGRWIDSVIARFTDIQLAFPPILLAILLVASLGQSVVNLVIAVALTRWVKYARVVRGATLEIRERGYVSAAQALGVPTWRVLARHVLPFVMTPLVVVATVEFGLVVLTEAGLSFIGLGVPSGTPSWGLTISNGKNYLDTAWWISAMPGIALALTVLCVGYLGDRLRDYLHPYRSTHDS